jgi:hypothetical protein
MANRGSVGALDNFIAQSMADIRMAWANQGHFGHCVCYRTYVQTAQGYYRMA